MNKQKKAEWKGMLKGISIVVLVLAVIGIVSATVFITDEGIWIGDTVAITEDTFSHPTVRDSYYMSYFNNTEKVYEVPAVAYQDSYVLEVYQQVAFKPIHGYATIRWDPLMRVEAIGNMTYNRMRIVVGVNPVPVNPGDNLSDMIDMFVMDAGQLSYQQYDYFESYISTGIIHDLNPDETYYLFACSAPYAYYGDTEPAVFTIKNVSVEVELLGCTIV